MTPSLPEILRLATRMAQLDSHPTCDASPKSRAPGPLISSSLDIARPRFVTSNGTIDPPNTTFGSVPQSGIPPCGRSISALIFAPIALSNAGILLPQGGIRMRGGDGLLYE